MKFILNVSTDNAAFHRDTGEEWEHDPGPELARILRKIADKVEHEPLETYTMFQTILDVNGNDVGRYALKPDDYR